MGSIFILDVRELEPPGPLEEILGALENYQNGQPVHVKHRREPCLLFPTLKNQGFSYRVLKSEEDLFEMVIWRTTDLQAVDILKTAGYSL